MKSVSFVQTVTLDKEKNILMKVDATSSYNTDPSIFGEANVAEVMPVKAYMKFTFPVIRSGNDVWFEIQHEVNVQFFSHSLGVIT